MRLKICAQIDGRFLLNESLVVPVYSYELSIFKENGKHYISITAPIKDYMTYVKPILSNANASITATVNSQTFKDMIDWLHYIEAMGAFNFEVRGINFDEIEMTWVGENEEEKRLVSPIKSIKSFLPNNTPNKPVTQNTLLNIIHHRRFLRDFQIPFGFYRQGSNFLHDQNYHLAYINYFMMIEYCFANGKFKKKEVMQEFKKSDLLKLCILETLQLLKKKYAKTYNLIKEYILTKYKRIDFDGVVYLLVDFRGILSHSGPRSKKYILDDKLIQPFALLINSICFSLCGYFQIYCNNISPNSAKQRIKDKIIELENISPEHLDAT